MDIVDAVAYRHEPVDPEATRQAFVNLFDVNSAEARLVMRHFVQICHWTDQTEYNDPIIESKMNSLRGVIREVKKQLNMERIENE